MIQINQNFSFKIEKEKFDQNNNLVYSFIERLSMIAKNEIKHPEYLNLVTIFFHEIVTLYSNTLILKNSSKSYNNSIRVPFLNSSIITEFDSTNIQDYSFKPREVSKSTFSQLNEKINWFRSNKICLGPNFNKYHIHNNLTDFLKTPVVLSKNPQIFIEDVDSQLMVVEEFIRIEFDQIQVNTIQIIKLFKNYIKSYLSKYELKLSGSLFLTGSNANITSRIISANFRKNNLPVISICHGEHSIRVFNEPVFYYAELSMLTHYIDFGQSKVEAKSAPINIVYRTSEKVKKLLNSKTDTLGLKKNSLLYVPTSYSQNFFYGPHRSFEDHIYIEWQKFLLKDNEQLTIKAHPKSKVPFKISRNQQIGGFLEDAILQFDQFVFDYVSTAFALACATKKPILYFDLGIRNLSEEATQVIKNRCFYYKIDFNADLSTQITEAFECFKDFKNYDPTDYSERFSVNKENDNEWSAIKAVVDQLRNT